MKDFRKNLRAAISPAAIFGLVIGFFVLAYCAPIALNYLAVAVNTSVNSTVKTVMTVLVPVLFALGVAMYFIPGRKH